jgi:pyruvate dehydrogenase E1 component beta subunit
VVREGKDATLLAYGAMLHTVNEAAETLEKEDGTSCEVLDLRTLVPLDTETIMQSVKKTGRAVVVHEAPKTCGFGAELIA